MADTQDSAAAAPLLHLPCDDDHSAPPTSPGRPEVETRRDLLMTSPDAADNAVVAGVTCDAPASPIGAAARQEREQVGGCSDVDVASAATAAAMTSSFGDVSHVTRLQSFVDSMAAAPVDDVTSASWLRHHARADVATSLRQHASSRIAHAAAASADEPLDLSVKPPARSAGARRALHGASAAALDDVAAFPRIPAAPPPSLYPGLLASRDCSWVAHWAALAAASLHHSLLLHHAAATAAVTSRAADASGPTMTSSSPRSHSASSSSSPKMAAADDKAGRRGAAIDAVESLVQQASSYTPAHGAHLLSAANRKRRRRHLGGPEVTSSGSGDEDEIKRQRRADSVAGASWNDVDRAASSPRCDDAAAERRSPAAMTSLTRPEVVNGGGVEGGDGGGYLRCGAPDSAKEHPLVSLEKFVGVSAPLFRQSAAPPSAATSNGVAASPPPCRSPGAPPPPSSSAEDDVAMTSSPTSRSVRGGELTSGSSLHGRAAAGFAHAQSLLCCNL